MKDIIRILIVEDLISDYELAQREIRKFIQNCSFERVEKQIEFLQALKEFRPQVILSDYQLPAFTGMEALQLAQQHLPSTPLIVWTGALSEDVAVDCMKKGASNYILKENIKRLGPAVIHALEERKLHLERKQAEEKYQAIFANSPVGVFQSTPEGKFISANSAMANIYGYASPQEMITEINDIASAIYVDAGDRQQFIKLLHDNNIVNNFEMKNRKKDGSIFWTSTSARVVQDEVENILYYEGFLQDITQRKQAEDALKNNEMRFRSLIENGLDDISLLDIDGNLIWESPSTVRNLGYSPNQFVGKSIFAIMHPDDLGWVTDLFKELIQKPGSRQHQSFRLQRSDGTWRWVEAITTNMLNEPSVQAIVVNYRDVTERKQAEQALRESEEKYRLLFESNPMPMWIYDLETLKFLKVNDAAVEHYGYSVEDFLGMTIKEIRPSEDVSKLLENIALSDISVHQRVDRSGIWRHRKKDGTVMMVDIISHLVEFEGRKAELVLANDVTEHKQAEQKLLESQAKYQNLVETSHDLIWAVDAEGKITFLNRAAKDIYGYEPEELIGRSFFEIMAPAQYHHDPKAFKEAIAEVNESQSVETYVRHRDGRQIILSANSIVTRDEDGNVIGVTGSSRDITESRQAELERQVLLEIMQGLANTSDLQAFLKLIHGAIAKVIHAENFFVVFHRPDSGLFEEIYTVDQYDSPAEPSMLEKSITSYVFRSGEPLLLTQERFEELVEQGELELVGTNSASWLGVPLKTANGIIGVMAVQDYHDPNRYTERDKDFLASIESQVALAIERKRAEELLRESEERFSNAFEYAPIGKALVTLDGKWLRVNHAICDMVGYSAEELLKKTFQDISQPDDLERDLNLVGQVLAGEIDSYQMEKRYIHKMGHMIWVLLGVSLVRDNEGKPLYFISQIQDITERKNAEFETRRHLTEMEALYENGLAVGQLLKQEEIGNRIIETFARYLSWHHVAIRLLRPGTDELELVAFNLPGLDDQDRTEMEQHFNKTINKVGRGLSGWVVQTREPLRTGNVHSHAQYVDTQAGIESGLYMPLKIGERIIGVISVESDLPDAFTAQDERLLATLANQAAVAFENARLYQKIQLELTERKKAEDALRTSETHYRDLADSITDILFEIDHDLRYIHWNKASEIFFGIPATEAIGKSIQELFGNLEDSLRWEEIYRSVLRERQAIMFQTEIVPGGQNQERILEINAYPSARGVSVVAKDVTERKRNETLLENRFELMEYSAHHDLQEMMQKAVDLVCELTGSHIGFYFLVDDDEKTLNIQTCSVETMLVFNVPQSEGMHLPLDQAGVWAEAARQRRSVIHNDYERLAPKKGLPDGHIPISRELTVPIIRNEKLVALIGIGNKESDYAKEDVEIVERFVDYAWDITERKQMENQLADERVQLARRVEERTADLSRANSNLARALHVKDEFLANMSHELRTPLNAILGLSESLGEQVAGPLNEKQQKYLTTINESGHHLLSLINDILDLAKIEAGQITLDINKVDVNSVCQASLRMVKQLAQKKNQDLVLEIDDDLGLMWADERRLKQMIVNLLSNAVKFTPEAGRLGLEVHGDRNGNKVTLTVWDNGIGISPGDMERLFRPFVQLDSGLAREATGTGLGLALVAQMARLHGGSVTVQSQPGEGSRFSIQLPWEPALASDAAIRLRNTGKFQAIDPLAKNRPTILLIEDTKEVVMMLMDYLEMAGYKVVTAQDGIDGIAQAKLSHPNLILMDIQMPRMDGFETTQKLRSDPEFKEIPIIALTALAMSDDRERCLAAGMNEYISKPVNLKTLVRMIRQFLFESRESTPS